MLIFGGWLFPFWIFLTLPDVARPDDLPPLSPAYPELPPTFWEQHQTMIIVSGFAFLAFAFLLLKTMLRPDGPKILPPESMARQALNKLQNQPEDGHVLSAVSQILRRYTSETFNLPNTELTTSEFCGAISTNPQIGAELAAAIVSFLRECDVRKFSPAGGDSPMNAVQRALKLVNEAETQRARSAPFPDTASPQSKDAATKPTAGRNSDTAASGDGRTP